jgi:hypothetical protein
MATTIDPPQETQLESLGFAVREQFTHGGSCREGLGFLCVENPIKA